MFTKVLSIAVITALMLLTSCANQPPVKNKALQKDSATISKSGKSIFLLTINLRNSYKVIYQPKLYTLNVEKIDANGGVNKIKFMMDDIAKNESTLRKIGNSYLLRIELERGEYILRGLTSVEGSWPIPGNFFVPLHANLKSTGSGAFYLGHVDANIRERQGAEFRAGPLLPLYTQDDVGASGGTYDIKIADEWEKDGPNFLNKFPALNGLAIQKSVLPPFDKDVAQKWWASH